MRRLIWFLLALVMTLAPITVPVQAQDGPTYAARGPYWVGARDFVIEDAARPLDVTVWYPALNPDHLPEEIAYQVLSLAIEGQAIPNAAPDSGHGPYPLVVFSHGAGGFRQQSVFFTEHLASYGFVVIAADHPGSTLEDFLGDNLDFDSALSALFDENADLGALIELAANAGGEVNLMAALATSYALRPFDVVREIDFAATLAADGPFAGVIDTDRVAVTGHSFGGYTTIAAGGARLDYDAMEAWCRNPQQLVFHPGGEFTEERAPIRMAIASCILRVMAGDVAAARGLDSIPAGLWPPTTDPRIRAVVALAPWNATVFGSDGLAALTVPAMIQVGTADQLTPPEIDAYRFYAGIGSADKALVVFEGANHFLFANRGLGVDDRAWDMGAAHDLINHFAIAFLLAHLYGDAGADAALAPEAVDFDGVYFLRDTE
jgi:predicted dienelactone hydrolase